MVQVPPEHYGPAGYDEFNRWVSYWYQIRAVQGTGARSVLEVGKGSGLLSWYMRERLGIRVVTADFEAALAPDVVVDVRDLASRFPCDSFDLVCAFQVLEHLPFCDFRRALEQMAAVSRSRVIISLPNNGHTLQMRLHLWRFQLSVGRKFAWRRHWRFDGEHYWEVGTHGHQPEEVRRAIREVFSIERETVYPDYPYHRSYELRKRS